MPSHSEIKKALEVLSAVSISDCDGIEAEMSCAIASLSNIYQDYVNNSIVQNNCSDFIKSNFTKCPVCLDSSNLEIVSLNLDFIIIDPVCEVENKKVKVYTESESHYIIRDVKSEDLQKLKSLANDSYIDYLFNNFFYCKVCNHSFSGNEFTKNICGKEIPFEDILKWKKSNNQ